MATTTSTKPGEIGGTSILAKRSPTYRLVLKVDPTSGQYKYEYEVDDAPRVSDVMPTNPVIPEVSGTPDPSDPSDPGDSSPTPGPTPENPGTSFEQTKKMLAGGGGDRNRQEIDSGEYRMNNDGSVGYRRANQDNFITVNKTSPGAQRFMAGLTKGVSAVTNTIKDYATTGGILGSAVKDIFSGSKAAEKKEYDPSYNQMPAGFVDANTDVDAGKTYDTGLAAPTQKDVDKVTREREAQELMSGSIPGVDNRVDFLGRVIEPSAFTTGQLNQKIADLQARRNNLTSGFTKGELYAGTIANIDKEIQQTNELLNSQISNRPVRRPNMPKRALTGPQELGASTRSDIGEAVREGNISRAVDIAKSTAGSMAKSRDSAQRDMDKARVGATTNNSVSNYGKNSTSTDKRNTEKNKDVADARSAAGKTEAARGRTVDKGNAVDNKARSNELSDKHGNAVTAKDPSTGKSVSINSKKKDKDKGGGGKQGRIICSELYNKGLISKEDYMLDLYYTSKHLTPQHTAGYWHFAVPAVKAMRRSKFWTAFWREIAYNRLQDIKWRLGYGKFTLRGRIYSAIFEPFCYISGYFKPNATYKELYKGEY